MTTSGSSINARVASEGRRIGLSLSGGGFRASLFHIGVLARLAELDLLRQIEVISAVSGGSIVGALYHLYLKRELEAHGEIDASRLLTVVSELEQHFLSVVQMNLRWQVFADVPSNLRLARADFSRTDRLGDLLDQHLYRPVWNGDKSKPVEMRALSIHPRGDHEFNPITDNAARHCKVPILLVHATTLNTGHNWRFETERMGEPAGNPTERQVDKNLLLAQSRYQSMTKAYARMPLGKAVAASAAVPGIFEPLPLSRLYAWPAGSRHFLSTQLVDGGVFDNLGTEALLERGCTHVLVSDASGQLADQVDPDLRPGAVVSRVRDILMDRIRELQLARIEEARPGRTVVMHLLREVEAPELQAIGPNDQGSLTKDRSATDVTSYGVERRLQRLLADVRTDLDAFHDTEAFALMADGYLMTRRAFEQHDQKGEPWCEGPPYQFDGWRFSAFFNAMRLPPKSLIRRLEIARHTVFKGQRLAPWLRVELALALIVFLGLISAFLWSGLANVLQESLKGIVVGFVLLLLAFPAHLILRWLAQSTGLLAWLRHPAGLIGRGMTIAAAVPLFLASKLHLHAGRRYLKAGELSKVGVQPITPPIRPEPYPSSDVVENRDDQKAA